MNKNKKILIFSLILILGLVAAGEVFAVSWRPLVPCGRSDQGYTPCTFCQILDLAKNIFDFLSIFFCFYASFGYY